MSLQSGQAFLPTLSFWKRAVYPVFASVDSSGLGVLISNNLSARSVTIGGPGIIAYKAVLITSGTCNSAGVAASLLAATETSIALSYSFTPPGGTTDGYFTVCAIGKNFVNAWQNENVPTSSYTLHINTVIPVITALNVNNGTVNTEQNVVPVDVDANHPQIDISHFCLKSLVSGTAPVKPEISDACWKALDGVNPAQLPAMTISFNDFNFNIGYTEDYYNVYVWVRSESGTISNLTNSGSGTVNTDKFSIAYFPPTPPQIINVIATNSDSPANPISDADLYIAAGQSVYIKWKATDDLALAGNAISISYTVNESTFTSVVSGVANSAGAGCTINANYTGCYKWTNGSPVSTYFKVRVGVTDTSDLIAYAASPPNNTAPFSIIAGNTDLGLNGSAATAILRTRNSASINTGAGRFVVRSDGNVFILDDRGLLRIDPFDGLLKLYMSITGTITNGSIASATLRAPIKMSLDAEDNLWIYDYNAIRKINFATNQISTVIGGGTQTTDGILATQLQINPITSLYEHALFTILPNGNIWFQTNDDFYRTRDAGAKVRYYDASDSKVYIITPSGTGSYEDAGYDPSSYTHYSFGILFDPVTSVVSKIRSYSAIPIPGGRTARSVTYNPVHGGTEATHIPFASYWADDNTFTSMGGVMYNVDHYNGARFGVSRYNPDTNTWIRILGTGAKGQCPDGTLATTCATDLSDLYVSPTGQVYVIDRNRVRVIDSNNKIQTLFGQSLAFGDDGQATSARFSQINWIDQTSSGTIILTDNNETVMREFSIGGDIVLLAGNGSDGAPNTTASSTVQPIVVKYWGASYPFTLDPNTGDVFYTRSGTQLSRLNHSTLKWSDIVGGGGTSYKTADGVSGTLISLTGYQHGVLGYDGSNIMRHLHEWDGTQYVNSQIKIYDTTASGVQSHFAGQLGANIAALTACVDGSDLATCNVPSNHTVISKAQWDSINSRWLLLQAGTTKIRTAVVSGTIGTLVTLPRAAQSFKYIIKATVPYVYYCASGRMYRYNTNIASETALFWPSSTITCDGYSLVWDSTRNSIIFPIKQNGIAGVAEILDP